VNNSLQTEKGTVDGSGNWAISGVTKPSANSIITVFATDGDGDIADSSESTAVGKYSGSGNMTDMVLNANVLSIGGVGDQSVSISDLVTANYDADQDEDIMYDAETGSLLVQAAANSYSAEKINILTSDTFSLGNSESLTTYDLTITGTLISGTLGTLNVAHDWTNNGSFTQSTSTVDMNGSTAQTINGSTSTTFNNLVLSNTSAAVSTGGNESVNETLTINANAVLSPGASYTIGGSGTLTGSGTAQVTRASGDDFANQYTITNKTLDNLTVDYTGSTGSGLTITNTFYGSSGKGGLKISGSIVTGTQTATVSGIFTVTGTFTPSGGFITFSTYGTQVINSGSLTFYNLRVLSFSDATTSSSFSIAGALTTDTAGPFRATGGTITFTGGSISVSSGSGLDFKNLTISGTTTTSSSFSVDGTLNVNGGNLSPSNGTITLKTGSQITNTGTLAFSGLTVDTSAAVTANNSFSTNGSFTVNSGATFTPVAAAVMNGSGTLTGSGTVQVTRTTSTPDFLSQYTITNKTLTDLTVAYVSDSSQTVSAVNYGNLLSSGNGSRTLASSGTIGISGTFTIGTNTYTVTGSTVDYNGAGQTVAAINYNNLALSNSGTKTLQIGTTSIGGNFTLSGTASSTLVGDLSVAGQVTVNTGATFGLASSGYSLILTGSGTGTSRPLYMNGGSLTEGTNSTVKFTGTAASDIQNETYYHLELSPSGGSTPTYTLGTGASQTITTQNLTIGNGTNGVAVTASSNNPILDINGDMTINNGVSFTGGTQTINVGTDTTLGGDFTLESGSTWNAGSGTLILEGGDDSNLVYFNDKNGTKQNMGNVQIGASPSTTNMSSNMVANSLTVSAGDKLNTRGYDLDIVSSITVNGTLNATDSVAGDGTLINLGGNWTVGASATFTADTSLVTFDGSGAQSISPGGTDANHDFNNLTIANTGGPSNAVTFSDSCTVGGTFADNTADSKVIFTVEKTFVFQNIDIDGAASHNVTMTSTNASPGTLGGLQWFLNVAQSSPVVSYVTVYDSDANGGNEIDATNNCTGVDYNNEHWNFGTYVPDDAGHNSTYEGTVNFEGQFDLY
jgi:fibronectin-binding autotransporter adhesin